MPERDNEVPRSAKAGDVIGDALSDRRFSPRSPRSVARGAKPHELLGGMELAASTASMSIPASGLRSSRMAISMPVDFDADGSFDGGRTGLMRSLSSMEAKPKNSPCVRLVHHYRLMIFVYGG